MELEEAIRLHNLAMNEAKKYRKKRFIWNELKKIVGKRPFVGIVGPRGSGKTVLLRQIALENRNAFYLSLDSLILDEPLLDFLLRLGDLGYKIFLLDEIHYYPGFERELKRIYDFTDFDVIFTSSCSIEMKRIGVDLSRRVILKELFPPSFREHLYFMRGIVHEPLRISDLFFPERYRELLGYGREFEFYLKTGGYAFWGEVHPSLFKNLVFKTLMSDIRVKAGLTQEEVYQIYDLLKFISISPAGDHSFSSLSKELGITKYKVKKYLELLESAFLIHIIWPFGTNVKKEPKILVNIPFRLVFSSYYTSLGSLGEDFFVSHARALGLRINYLKEKRGRKVPDYIIDDTIFEIGGKSKSFRQLKGVKAGRRILLVHEARATRDVAPLWVWGFVK